MINAKGVAVDQRRNCGGKMRGIRRRTYLIIDHSHLRLLLRKCADGLGKIAPDDMVEPGGADKVVLRVERAHDLFTSQFTCSINGERLGAIKFMIGART